MAEQQLIDPVTRFPKPPFKRQSQEPPGLACKMEPRPEDIAVPDFCESLLPAFRLPAEKKSLDLRTVYDGETKTSERGADAEKKDRSQRRRRSPACRGPTPQCRRPRPA